MSGLNMNGESIRKGRPAAFGSLSRPVARNFRRRSTRSSKTSAEPAARRWSLPEKQKHSV